MRVSSPRIFTTGQVAKICKVSTRTVCKWFDSGRLKGYRIPGSLARRIPLKCLLKFLRENGAPYEALENQAFGNVLVVSESPDIAQALRAELSPSLYRVQHAVDGFGAGMRLFPYPPDCIVVDFSNGGLACKICCTVRAKKEFAETLLLGLAHEPTWVSCNQTVIQTFEFPNDTAPLAAIILDVVGNRKGLARW